MIVEPALGYFMNYFIFYLVKKINAVGSLKINPTWITIKEEISYLSDIYYLPCFIREELVNNKKSTIS